MPEPSEATVNSARFFSALLWHVMWSRTRRLLVLRNPRMEARTQGVVMCLQRMMLT